MPDIFLKQTNLCSATASQASACKTAECCCKSRQTTRATPSRRACRARETNAETLVREFREEIGAQIAVRDLKWVAEIFFPWGDKPCHQICLYYLVDILTPEIPKEGSFIAKERLEDGDSTSNFTGFRLTGCMKSRCIPRTPASCSAGSMRACSTSSIKRTCRTIKTPRKGGGYGDGVNLPPYTQGGARFADSVP